MIALTDFTKYRGVIGKMIRDRGPWLVKSKFSTKLDQEDLDKIEKELELRREEEEKAILEGLRNKSRLIEKDFKIQHSQPPITSTMLKGQDTVGFKRTLYGHYGSKSNVNPSILWPSTEELEAFKEYESVAHPKTLSELIEEQKSKKEDEEKQIEDKKKEILKKMSKRVKQIDDFNSRVRDSFMKALEMRKRKDKLISDIRMKIGYDISVKDELFLDEWKKLEDEEKNILRLRRRAKRLGKRSENVEKIQTPSKETDEETKPAD